MHPDKIKLAFITRVNFTVCERRGIGIELEFEMIEEKGLCCNIFIPYKSFPDMFTITGATNLKQLKKAIAYINVNEHGECSLHEWR